MSGRALIIGGGIAGPATALALHKAGWTSEVFEARPESEVEDAGIFLTLGSNGIDALRTLDAGDRVLEHGFATPAIELRSHTGKPLGVSRIGTRLSDGTTSRTLRRADLYAALRQELDERGLRVEYGRRLAHVADGQDGVTARFSDDSEEHGDVVIGCDGIRSTVRAWIDPTAPGPDYAGLVNHGGFAPAGAVEGEPGDLRMIFGRRAFFGYAVATDGEVWWFANEPARAEPARRDLAALGPDEVRARLGRLFADDQGPAVRIIEASHAIAPPTSMHTLGHLPTWHRDRTVVLGDAAHAPSPSSGQGASLAIEDAVVLAQCLRDLPDPGVALRRFEELRRPRVERILKEAARVNSSKAATGPSRVMRDLLLPLVLRFAGTRGMERTYGHHIEWDEPVA